MEGLSEKVTFKQRPESSKGRTIRHLGKRAKTGVEGVPGAS